METPKARFQQAEKDVSWLADVTVNSIFVRATDAALLQMQSEVVGNEQPDAMRGYFRMEGAQLFIKSLMNIAEKKVQKVIADPDRPLNLNHKV